MCGIAGIWMQNEFTQEKSSWEKNVFMNGSKVTSATFPNAVLSSNNSKLITDEMQRFTLLFCGSLYNFDRLIKQFQFGESRNMEIKNPEDAVLNGLIRNGIKFLNRIEGDFALCFYDAHTNNLLLARDRYGNRPMYYCYENQRFTFSSTLAGIANTMAKKEINEAHLATYLQLSYSPAPQTILKNVFKLEPGHFLHISSRQTIKQAYYKIPHTLAESPPGEMNEKFQSLLNQSVIKRMENKKRCGTFLSGGIDSSVISLLAHRHDSSIPAFSLGFPDHPYFDEAARAKTTARHLGMKHHLIQITNKELVAEVEKILDAFDEPFADSSSILMNFLCKYAAGEVDVVLSGDGADEIMGGYNKHRALLQSLEPSTVNEVLKLSNKILQRLPESRNSKTFNFLRKIKRYSNGLDHDFKDRYFEWSSFTPRSEVNELLLNPPKVVLPWIEIDENDFNSVLIADTTMVLPNDMLYKLDIMGLRQNLEIRTPFLDRKLVDFLFRLPWYKKLDRKNGKRILYTAYEKDFPKGFFKKSKKGFEAPLSEWLDEPLAAIVDHYLSADFLKSQGIFRFDAVKKLEQKAKSDFPGDSPHTLWALVVFQAWYSKHFIASSH